MNAKTYLQWVIKWLNGFIYIVGVFAICWFLDDRWPHSSFVIYVCGITVIVAWSLWRFFFRPFRSALKGEDSKPDLPL